MKEDRDRSLNEASYALGKIYSNEKDDSDYPLIEDFLREFLQTYSQFFLFHWQTKNHGSHVAFDEANEDLEDMMDRFVEAYQGKYGRVFFSENSSIQLINFSISGSKSFIQNYIDFLINFKKNSLKEEDIDLSAVLDEMVGRLNKLLYLLTFNKK